jgi:sulfur transfer complex TusBCD TusB component (DsrH family)
MPLIYESPDGGKTVYARELGHTDRHLVKGNLTDPYEHIYLWHDIVHAAKDNPALREVLDQAIMIYKLSKEQP